ncbi:hypothetical protein FQA39_LY10314 [Lamprigera yunnana]|nr:hypothetical protein FQA39_LY10314 [Lamprigera yunnana]
MEIIRIAGACEEPEEGEIIEDDLEDVSDSSMFPSSPVNSGKSVSPELLSAVCLSSVSSSDYCTPNRSNHYAHDKWKHRRRRRECKHKHRRKVSADVISNSDTEFVDPKYAKQLRDALKHETPQELHNSLRTRLKGFIGSTSSHSEEDSLILDDKALSSLTTSTPLCANQDKKLDKRSNLVVENFEDSELFELRMAALKSVVLEKHERRKQRKEDLEFQKETNKENDCSILNDQKKPEQDSKEENLNSNEEPKIVNEIETNNTNGENNILEDDADILRAMLLASMTKTLSKGFSANTNEKNTKINNKNTLFETKSSLAKHAIVRPLIIKVNGDSDSDMEVDESDNVSFKHTVTEFLKKQRAEVEENVKKKEENLNKSEDSLMDKSVMRLLPRSQQLEYRQLKQRLLNARKKGKLRRSSRISENGGVKKVPKVKADVSTGTTSFNNVKVKKNQEGKGQPNFQKTLSDLQIRKNGRLQMKGKYRSLGVLLQKINHASNIRKQHELEIKKLLHEIQKARIKLAASHQNFTSLVQQLVKGKQSIDQSGYKVNQFTLVSNQAINIEVKKVNHVKEHIKLPIPEVEMVKEENKMLEPNDVTKMFVKQSDVLKYTSPLDNRYNASEILR